MQNRKKRNPATGMRREKGKGDVNIIYRGVNHALDWERRLLAPGVFHSCEGSLPKIGGLLPLWVVVGLFCVAAITDSRSPIISNPYYEAAGLSALYLGLGYLGYKFTRPCQVAVDSNPTTISTRAPFDVLALLLSSFLVLSFVGLCVTMFNMLGGTSGGDLLRMFFMVTPAYGILLMWLFFFLHPAMVNVTVDEQSTAGKDLLSLIGFGYKLLLSSTPFLPAFLVFWGLGAIEAPGLYDSFGAGMFAGGGPLFLATAMVFPAIAYFIYILLYVQVAFLENILSIKSIPALLGSAADENERRSVEMDMLAAELDELAGEFHSSDSRGGESGTT